MAGSALSADPAALGPALTAAGAKLGPTYFSRNAVLQIKAEAPLPEPVWQEIEVLAPHELGASGKGFDDAAVARLARLPLEVLYLDGSSLTEVGWAVFRSMPHLTKLSLSHNLTWKGAGAASLARHPALLSLSIGGSTFGDTGLPAIASIRQLQRLSLNHATGVTDAGLTALAGHPSLEVLQLSPQGMPRITDECLKTVVTLKALKELTFNDTVLSYDGGLHLLKGLPALQKLTLLNIGLGEADLQKLKADLPKVEIKFTAWAPELVAKWEAQRAKMRSAKP